MKKTKEYPKIICLDIAVCSSWGTRLPKHIFKTQYAFKSGHNYCLNCGLTKREVRKEERFNKESLIETRIVDFHSDLKNPTFLSEQDIKDKNYKVFI